MDEITRGTVLNEEVRVFCCRTTEMVEKARKAHDLWPNAAAALGRTMSVGCIMGCMLKDKKEKIEIQIDGNGPIGQIVVDCYCNGAVRGYVQNPHVYKEKTSGKLDVGAVVGTNGLLRVVKDMGMKTPFKSEVALQSGEIGDDFAYYYAVSEQTPSAVSVGVLVDTDLSVKSAGALIIQLMPNATEESIRIIEDIVANIKPISQLLLEYDSPKDIVDALFEDYQELDSFPLQFKCECNKGRFARILRKLPASDLQEMIDDDHGCEVVCKFCGKKYWYPEETLQGFIDGKKVNQNKTGTA